MGTNIELVQVRIDKETKAQAQRLYESLGLDLSTAVRVFLRKSILAGGLPFDLTMSESDMKALQAIESMRTTSELNGNSEMSLEEINAEIAAARGERKKKS